MWQWILLWSYPAITAWYYETDKITYLKVTWNNTIALIIPQSASKGVIEEPRIQDFSNLIKICHTNSFQVVCRCSFFCQFYLCPSNDILYTNEILWCYYWDPLQTGILIATKKTYVNPKQRSDCPIFLSSYCQTKQGRSCRKYNCTTNWPYPGWGYPYRGPHRYLHLCFQPYSTPYVYFWLKLYSLCCYKASCL